MSRLNQLQAEGFLQTPPLWDNRQFEIEQFDFPEIDLTNFNVEAVSQKLRLGHQMEYIFKQLVLHSNKYEILLHNLPIKDGNRTIGEIDFILKDGQTGTLIHIELTYKFYIIDSQIADPIHRLIGPNKRDTFFAKMEKIKNKQFQLIHSEEGSKALNKIQIDHKLIEHQACCKAQLFTPFQLKERSIKPLNKACICGYWLHFEDLKAAYFKSFQFYIPMKSEWVIEPHDDVKWNSYFKACTNINQHILKENAPMVWLRKADAEYEKFFVVF